MSISLNKNRKNTYQERAFRNFYVRKPRLTVIFTIIIEIPGIWSSLFLRTLF